MSTGTFEREHGGARCIHDIVRRGGETHQQQHAAVMVVRCKNTLFDVSWRGVR